MTGDVIAKLRDGERFDWRTGIRGLRNALARRGNGRGAARAHRLKAVLPEAT